jgi:carbon-monoxide dehydrogenase medium subunit
MKSAPFDYVAPDSLDEVLGLLDQVGEDGKILAGGQSLMPLLALRMSRFDQLIDVNGVAELRGIFQTGAHIVIGAATTQSAVPRNGDIAAMLPIAAEATALIGHFQIRNRGTVGGSIAFADPAAEWPALALALDAEAEVANTRGRRLVPIDELLESAWVTTLAPDDLLVSVRIPVPAPRTGAAIAEIARRHGDFALVGVVASVTLDPDGSVSRARVVVFGLAQRAARVGGLEAELSGRPRDDASMLALARRHAESLDAVSDTQASASYRRAVAGPLIARALRQAFARAEASSDPVGLPYS